MTWNWDSNQYTRSDTTAMREDIARYATVPSKEFVTLDEFFAQLEREPDDPPELGDDDITPDEAEPLPEEVPIKTEPVPEEPQ